MYTKKGSDWIKHLDFILLDLICLNLAFAGAYFIRFRKLAGLYSSDYRNAILIWSLLLFIVSFLVSGYKNILRRGVYQELVAVILLQSVTFAALILAMYAGHIANLYSRYMFFGALLLSAALSFIGRLLLKKFVLFRMRRVSAKKQNARKVFVFTDSVGCDEILRSLNEDIFEVFSVEGAALLDSGETGAQGTKKTKTVPGVKTFSDVDAAVEFICREWIDEVFFYLPGVTQIPEKAMSACTEIGVTVHIMLQIPEFTREKQTVETMNGNTFLTLAYSYIAPHQAVIKRLFDILAGLAGSAFTLLLCLVIGPIIYIASPGPIFFKQKRIGKNGKQFEIYKFRSMYLDAEERKKELMKQNRVSDGMMFKLDFDPRVIGNRILPDGTRKTGIGEFIRKTSLDEFPQFFNVLKGDMSLVGTRPPTVDEWEKYEYHHRARLAVKPGITGMWQVSGRSKITDFEEVVRLDTKYILNYRLALDLQILLKTVKVVFERRGAM